MATIFLHIGTG